MQHTLSDANRARAQANARTEYERLSNLDQGYPANHFAFQSILPALAESGAQRVLEVGIGHGGAIPILAGAGLEVSGLDIDAGMVEQSRTQMLEYELSPDAVIHGDIEDATSYVSLQAAPAFDALVALGVLPHVHQAHTALRNMRALTRPGGHVFVECRNKLFSLVTFNRYTYEFFMDDLFFDAPAELRDGIGQYLSSRLQTDVPPPPATGQAPTFHNPLEVPELFAAAGFESITVIPFHYHPAMPSLESSAPQAFRDASIAMEHEASGWRGLFLCSAFLVQARRPITPG
jgi:2-polyprenyl-3-methyl-5-hydroxy-6-metoxy-1,4-benzoquinol methylase